jgi:hypothetical protein
MFRLGLRMARHAVSVTVAALLAGAALPLPAQRPWDAQTYFAAVLTPTAALPPLAMPAMLGRPGYGVGLDALYAYGRLSAEHRLDVHTVGASVELTTLAAHLSVSATGAYQIPDCGAAAPCEGYPMAGVGGTLRVATWDVSDDLSPGLATLSLHAEGGLGFPKGARARSAAAGLTVTLVGTHDTDGTLRVVAFGTPQAVWGHLRVDDPAELNQQFGTSLTEGSNGFEKSRVRFMAGGGLAVVSTRTGLGLHVAVQHVLIHGARPRVGAGVTWRSR